MVGGRLGAVGKHPPSRRYLLVLSCIALLGVALVADFLWASSSTAAASPYFSVEKAIGLLPPAPKKVSRHSLTPPPRFPPST